MIRAVVSDFGGVLTSPLMDSFAAFQESSGIPLEALYGSMATIAQRAGVNPLYELETGRLTESRFLAELGEQLTATLGRPVSLDGFGEAYFENLHPNGSDDRADGDPAGRGLPDGDLHEQRA